MSTHSPEQDAVHRATRLAWATRAGSEQVARALDGLDEAGLRALAVALAAMLPADVNPYRALAWCDLRPKEWPDAVVRTELARHEAGARDWVALAADGEAKRRFRLPIAVVPDPPEVTAARRSALVAEASAGFVEAGPVREDARRLAMVTTTRAAAAALAGVSTTTFNRVLDPATLTCAEGTAIALAKAVAALSAPAERDVAS